MATLLTRKQNLLGLFLLVIIIGIGFGLLVLFTLNQGGVADSTTDQPTINLATFETILAPEKNEQYNAYHVFVEYKNIEMTARFFNMSLTEFVFGKLVSDRNFYFNDWCTELLPEYYGAGLTLGITTYRECDFFGDKYLVSLYPDILINYDDFVRADCVVLDQDYLVCQYTPSNRLLLEKYQ